MNEGPECYPAQVIQDSGGINWSEGLGSPEVHAVPGAGDAQI